jgi:deoxyribonuclease-4
MVRLRIGIHCSTGGTLERAADKATKLGAEAFQIFSASPRMWRAKPVDPLQVAALQKIRQSARLFPLVIHGNYLMNFATDNPAVHPKSVDALRAEMERAIEIGAEYLVIHPGSDCDGLGARQAILNVAEAICLAWRDVNQKLVDHPHLTLLIENTAGAGNQLGADLSELNAIRRTAQPNIDIPVGICLDTCHLFAAGFDLTSEFGFAQMMKNVADHVGWENIPVIHVNDSKGGCGSHLDRHANIGDGYIGKEGFRRLLNHPRMRDKTFILETPADNPGDDLRDVTTLKELVFQNNNSTTKPLKKSGTRGGKNRPIST